MKINEKIYEGDYKKTTQRWKLRALERSLSVIICLPDFPHPMQWKGYFKLLEDKAIFVEQIIMIWVHSRFRGDIAIVSKKLKNPGQVAPECSFRFPDT
jgi:hypothetical protein